MQSAAAASESATDRDKVEKLVSRLKSVEWGLQGSVAYLVETPEPHRHARRDCVEVVKGRGFAGDHPEKSYYRGEYIPGREVSAITLEVLEALDVDPIVVGDNLTTKGIDLGRLEPADVMRIGGVLLERSERVHRPCATFRNRTSPEAFAVVSRARYRGALFVVRRGGLIRVGDAIRIESRSAQPA